MSGEIFQLEIRATCDTKCAPCVAAARAQAAADAAGAAVQEADMASALTAICQVATNALEVCPVPLCSLSSCVNLCGSVPREVSPPWQAVHACVFSGCFHPCATHHIQHTCFSKRLHCSLRSYLLRSMFFFFKQGRSDAKQKSLESVAYSMHESLAMPQWKGGSMDRAT